MPDMAITAAAVCFQMATYGCTVFILTVPSLRKHTGEKSFKTVTT